MELSTAWLEWLVLGAGRELMLFASVGILLFGLDDLLFDALWMILRDRAGPRLRSAPPLKGRLAIFLPAWKEDAILHATLTLALQAWEGEDFRVYIGCYPNDLQTILAVSPLVARDPRLRMVIGERDGPTTKGDNLNGLWAALGEDERAEGFRFAGVVLHDAEDHVHAEELALYRRELADCAMVQIPVVPFVDAHSKWIGGHYCDEFAESHGKEVVLRSRLGLPIPSAGVGCALSRQTVALLAIDRGGAPFRPDSLTEDYELGMLIGAYGLRARFVDALGMRGDRIASRGAFPASVDAAVRQKSRWIAGIALAGWDSLGWIGAGVARSGRDRWLVRWMLWRDRRAPLAALVLLAAYGALVLAVAGWTGQQWLGWAIEPLSPAMRLLFAANGVLLLWRLGMRGFFTARWYGLPQAMRALPRAFVANIIAILAARRAVALYWRMLRSGRVVWDKTDHVRRPSFAERLPS
ncbi:MAG: hypothetical protein C0520_03955 [Sphingopyxis sp.]|nr:hypothetical protein [Sphingopyxis sp.]